MIPVSLNPTSVGRKASTDGSIDKRLDACCGGSPFIGQKYFAIQIPYKNQIGLNLFKDPSQSVSRNCRIKGEFARWVRQLISKVINKPKTLSKLKWQDSAHMGMIFEMKFNTKEMLKHILVCASIKWWAHAINRDDSCTTENALVRTMPVENILDSDALGERCFARWLSCCEPNVLMAEIIFIVGK